MPGKLGNVVFVALVLAAALPPGVGAEKGNAQPNRPVRVELVPQLGHVGCINAVAFSSDGQSLVTGGEDKTICLWDLETGRVLRRLPNDAEIVRGVAFSPDGKTVLGSSGTTWDAKTGQVLPRVPRGDSFAFSRDGRCLLVGGYVAELCDVATRKSLWQFRGYSSFLCVALSPDGKRAAAGGDHNTVRLLDAGTGKQIHNLDAKDRALAVAFSPDGKRLIVGGGFSLSVWDAATGKLLQRWSLGESATAGAVSADGRHYLTGYVSGTIALWDVQTGQLLRIIRGQTQRIAAVAFSPDGQRIAATSLDETVCLWNAAAGLVLRSFPDSRFPVRSVAFSADGKQVLIAGYDQTAQLWDVAGAAPLHKLKGRLAVFAGRSRIATCDLHGTIRQYDVASGKEQAQFEAGEQAAGKLMREEVAAFSTDGKRLARASTRPFFAIVQRERSCGKPTKTGTRPP